MDAGVVLSPIRAPWEMEPPQNPYMLCCSWAQGRGTGWAVHGQSRVWLQACPWPRAPTAERWHQDSRSQGNGGVFNNGAGRRKGLVCYLPAGNSRHGHPKGSFKWPQFHQFCWNQTGRESWSWPLLGQVAARSRVRLEGEQETGACGAAHPETWDLQSHCLHLPWPELG